MGLRGTENPGLLYAFTLNEGGRIDPHQAADLVDAIIRERIAEAKIAQREPDFTAPVTITVEDRQMTALIHENPPQLVVQVNKLHEPMHFVPLSDVPVYLALENDDMRERLEASNRIAALYQFRTMAALGEERERKPARKPLSREKLQLADVARNASDLIHALGRSLRCDIRSDGNIVALYLGAPHEFSSSQPRQLVEALNACISLLTDNIIKLKVDPRTNSIDAMYAILPDVALMLLDIIGVPIDAIVRNAETANMVLQIIWKKKAGSSDVFMPDCDQFVFFIEF